MSEASVKAMTNEQLLNRVEYLVTRERELVECQVWHLQEVQNRKLYIQIGYTSLYECLVKHFKYSESVAYSRISVLKIINEVPQACEGLASGELNLTNLALAQSFIRTQEKETQKSFSAEEKAGLISHIKNKGSKEVKQFFAELSPIAELPHDQVRYLNETHVQIQFTAPKKLLTKVEYLKSLISHVNLNPTYSELLDLALDAIIEKTEKKKGIYELPQDHQKTQEKPAKNKSEKNEPAKETLKKESLAKKDLNNPKTEIVKSAITTQGFAIRSSRYIPRPVRKFVLRRAGHQCECVHKNGERCHSKSQLQYDHMKAFSKGGESNLKNIQLLCRVHNAHKGTKHPHPQQASLTRMVRLRPEGMMAGGPTKKET